ncbi:MULTISPECIES: peptidyl-dipeptidase Dcp [Chitinophagaceae]
MSGKFDSDNPFAETSNLSFSTFDFTKLHNSDFAPAFDEGMRLQLLEVDSITNNTAAPTFDNTVVALEKTGQLLSKAELVFNLLTGANTNDSLQKLNEDYAPKFAAHSDAIYLNDQLFKRVATIYDQRSSLQLDSESVHLVEFYYQQFVKAGAKLSDSEKDKLKKLNTEEAALSSKFNNQLLAGTKAGAIVIENKADLDGMSDSDIDAAAAAAKEAKKDGKWLLPLQNTTQQPYLSSLKNRDVRKKIFDASWMRTEKNDSNDTRKTISRLAQLRAQKAQLLGFKNYAAWNLQDQMAKTPEAVMTFLNELIPATVAKGKAEASDIQNLIHEQKDTFQLAAWDWDYYSEQVRKAKYDLDENEIKQYFVLDSVLKNGVFFAANQLYGISFKERKDIPVWQKDVRVFEVFDKDSSSMALFYCDYFKRDNKNGGAWMSNILNQSTLLNQKPVVYNICNFTKPADGQVALISFDDVTTMFHEFGHALHGMFASQKYPSLSGANTARDFVEFPSQFNEHWALYPTILSNYAKNYKTGESIPQSLIDKIKKAGTFNQGYAFGEYLAAAGLDMEWHTLAPNTPEQNVDSFEVQSLNKLGTNLSYIPPRYRSSYFLHIWANGYSAGYYAYCWSEMLDDDAYAWFIEHGGLSRANGQYFRDKILSRGNSEDLGTLYRNFRGHDPGINPLLKNRGLK